MATAKDIRVAPIRAGAANALMRRLHYSGKVVPNSQLHLGVFLNGVLEGAMQFGPSMDKRKTIGLVEGTGWNEFLELNRMAFSDRLPRNSESRALGVAMRAIRNQYPHVQWVLSFADATCCGDGTIYRAAGFVLTGIRENSTIWIAPDGTLISSLTITAHHTANPYGEGGSTKGGASMKAYREAGYRKAKGYQLRYIYFLDATARERLTVPELPYSAIAEKGAGMYLGEQRA